jgi:heptose-I-phosphate ethanolaminephosphotransferase
MLLIARIAAFSLVAAVYLLLGWLNWSMGLKLALLGAIALLAVSAWTTRHGYESKAGKSLVLLTAACFFAVLGFHAFLRDFFGVTPDDENVAAALFSSDQSEATEFVQQHARQLAKHVFSVLLAFVAFGSVVWWKPATAKQTGGPPRRRGAWIPAVAFSMVFLLLHLNPTLRKQNPVLYFPMRYLAWKDDVETTRELQAVGATAATDSGLVSLSCADDQPRTVVFVLGESITRLNFPLAGYPRKTTPELDSMGSELIWFPDVVSSDYSTTPSVQKMLTPATLELPDLWRTKPDVLVMAKKAGYKTFWLSNHSTDANGQLSIFVSHADVVVLANKGASRGEGSYDEVVLPYLETALGDPAPRKLIVLHLLNAHPAYYFRYPKSFARFNDADDAVTKSMKTAGRRFWAIRMRNYYDNAVLYTDHVLKRSLDLCRVSGQRLAWIYVPDHGQDAAHNTNFSGHNARSRSQFETLMIFWRSPSFPAPGVDPSALRTRPYQTDVFDHTLLGLLGISGDYYDPRRDILSGQFEKVARTIGGAPYP